MNRLVLASLVALAFASPVLAQKTDTAPAKAAAPPANTFFKGQTSSQVLGKESLIGAKVTGADNAALGTVDDIIVAGPQLEGLVLNIGDKKVGVRIGAVKISTVDGKATLSMPAVTPDMIKAVAAYQRAHAAAKK